MPLLGRYGKLELQRELPGETTLAKPEINYLKNTVYIAEEGFWTGDQINISAVDGIPILDKKTNQSGCPGGAGFYFGGRYALSPARATSATRARFYRDEDSVFFYDIRKPVGSATFYIYRNQLDEITLYDELASALNNNTVYSRKFGNVDSGPLVINTIENTAYSNSSIKCAGKIGVYNYSDIIWVESGLSLCEYAPLYTEPIAGILPYENSDVQPRGDIAPKWNFVSTLMDWTLNLKAAEVDTTVVGERYGTSIKSLVTGGGNLNFILDLTKKLQSYNSEVLMRLTLLLDKGCKAKAQFWLIPDHLTEDGNIPAISKNPGLYYETEVLFVSTALNLRSSEMIVGTTDFVSTGEINLKTSTGTK